MTQEKQLPDIEKVKQTSAKVKEICKRADAGISILDDMIAQLDEQPSWYKYEEYVGKILNSPELQKELIKCLNIHNLKILPKVPGKKTETGLLGKKTGTMWAVDAYGYDINNDLIIFECKHYTQKTVEQNIVAAFAYIIQDVGAKQGIIVTTKGLQAGARKVAEAESIGYIKLEYNSTEKNYFISLTENITIGKITEEMNLGLSYGSSKSSYKRCPIPNKQQIEEVKLRLKSKTNKIEFSEHEILEEFDRMQNESTS